MIVLDTSALIFWTLDRERLSEAAALGIAETDRTIVAVALLYSCPLVTSDRAIREFYPDAIW